MVVTEPDKFLLSMFGQFGLIDNYIFKPLYHQGRGVTLTFTGGHISLAVAFKGPNVILGLYICNYSWTRGKELYIQPFEGNHKAGVASSENEFDTLH